MSKATTSYTSALEYLLTKGYAVIPVGTDKKPLVNWKEYTKRLPTEEEVEAWWNKYPNAGVGIVTGKISQLTVVDIDVKGDEVTDLNTFPESYTVQTKSGGFHIYYEYSDAVQTGARVDERYPNVDIRNDGGYVVAPPSVGYSVLHNKPLAAFPADLFAKKKRSTKASLLLKTPEGGRNNNLTKTIGTLLRSMPSSLWETEVWEAVLAINQTYTPPLPVEEVRATFQSIANREKAGREVDAVVESPIQISEIEGIKMRLRGTKSGYYKDVTNAVFALGAHSEWKHKFKYDEFTQKIMFDEREIKPADVIRTQIWLQRECELNNISKLVVQDAIDERAFTCRYNSARKWLESLTWDGVPRVDTWIPKVYGVENDEYHRAIGSNWLRAVVNRIVWPGSQFDYVLVIQGGQGVRKTTAFLRLGGPWHMETIVQAESKDFLMQFQGKAIVELAEGGSLKRSETRNLKAIITRTHDKYRAPYARHDEEHPRQCVFCMTTNDLEFLSDETGNRRWWIVNMPKGVVADTDWIEENREQLFAEAYARVQEDYYEVPYDAVTSRQENARNISDLEEEVITWYHNLADEVKENGVTVRDFFNHLYRGTDAERIPKVIPWDVETKTKNAFSGSLGLTYLQKRDRNDWKERVRRWYPEKDT